MRAILLIAGNFIREQRWAVLAMAVWPFVVIALVRYDRDPHQDFLFALAALRLRRFPGVLSGGLGHP
jgi:hypothetical protein